jgi:ankyrin repeat protein
MFSFIKNIFKGTLHKACEKGNIEAVKQHLTDGADVNAKDNEGWTALHWAASWGDKEVAELLIKNGADIDAKDNEGETPLHIAAQFGQKEIVELLLSSDANVNAKENKGWTPLHHVTSLTFEDLVKYDSQLTVEQLVVKGADVNSMNEDRETPLDLLSSDELKGVTAKIAIFLRKHGGKTGKELEAAGN